VTPGPAQDEVRRLIERVEEHDARVRALSAVNPHASADAETLDRESAAGHRRSPLHGRAVLVKDNVDTAGLASTAGSLALADAPPLRDAALVRRLRDAGMVVLGKTNLSEWANIRDGRSTSGWSAHGGLTRNPYALNRTAWGSSSGSGAAIAAGFAAYAVGTETDGSITAPAAACGLVGLKPTVGLVPTEGVVPISWTQDSPGPMALTVADAAALLDAMAGTSIAPGLAAEPEGGLRGRRVGVPRDLWGGSPATDAAAERALSALSGAGAVVVDSLSLPTLKDLDGEAELTVLLVELKVALGRYLAARGGSVTSLADVIAFNREHSDEELLWFGQSLLEQAEQTEGVASSEYLASVGACAAAGVAELDRVLGEHQLDALLVPTMAPAPPIDLVNGDPGGEGPGASTSSALAGAPILTVPMELAKGLPVAVSMWGARGSDATLLELGLALESARDRTTGPLPPPTFAEWV
jgi:amidase